jgi:hypothetical protein
MSHYIEGGPGVEDALVAAAARLGISAHAIRAVEGGYTVPAPVAARYSPPAAPAPRRAAKKATAPAVEAEAPAEATEDAPDAEPDAPADDTQE